MTKLTINRPVCEDCFYYDIEASDKADRPVCIAFPKGIPDKIWEDGHKHRRPLGDQDNDITWTDPVTELIKEL